MTKTKEIVRIRSPFYSEKLANAIADYIVDCVLLRDKSARIDVKVMLQNNMVVVVGTIESVSTNYDMTSIVKQCPSISIIGNNKNFIVIDNTVKKKLCKCNGDPCAYTIRSNAYETAIANDETRSYLPLGEVATKRMCKKVSELTDFGVGYNTDVKTVVDYEDGKVSRFDMNVMFHTTCNTTDAENIIKRNIGVDSIIDTFDEWDDKHDATLNNKIRINIYPTYDMDAHGKMVFDDNAVFSDNYHGNNMCRFERLGKYIARYIAKNVVATGAVKIAEVKVWLDIYGNIQFNVDAKAIEKEFKYSNINHYINKWVNTNLSHYTDQYLHLFLSQKGRYWELSKEPDDYNDMYENLWEAVVFDGALRKYLDEITIK